MFLLASRALAGGRIPFLFMPFGNRSVAPSGLSLSHTANNRTFTVTWTAGSGNGGAAGCKIQIKNAAGSWIDASSPATINCDANQTGTTITMTSGSSPWTTISLTSQVRILRISNSSVVGTFGTTLACSVQGGSVTPTPDIDEDCNGSWDNTGTSSSVCAGVEPVAANGGEVPGNPFACPATDNTNYCTGLSVTSYAYFQCDDPSSLYTDGSCTTSTINGIAGYSDQIFSLSGTIPLNYASGPLAGYPITDHTCRNVSGFYYNNGAANYWAWGCYCTYNYDYTVYY